MNRYLVTAAVAALAGAVLASSPAQAKVMTGISAAPGAWGKAEEVPGTAALNTGGAAEVLSVSCASAGNCTAGGYYTTGSAGLSLQAFVVTQVNGAWGKAEEVPGTAALNKGGYAEVFSVSCASAGNCTAGGEYHNASNHTQAFVASQVRGAWRKAEEVPGSGALNKGGDAAINSVSCASAGNCGAAGSYTSSSGHARPLVVSEVGGVWGKAEQVPGIAALNEHGGAVIESLSCASAGNCSAGGTYDSSYSTGKVFVVSEAGGVWGKAEQVPGTAALNKGNLADFGSVSCASAGNCTAGGSYAGAGSFNFQAFVVSEVGGVWGKAERAPGTAALNKGLDADIGSVSCASAGNCSAGGYYSGSSQGLHAFVISQVNGAWASAQQVTGIGGASVAEVSCASAGNCGAGGAYGSGSSSQAFVAGQAGGVWGKAQEVPGSGALDKGDSAGVNSVSCAPGGGCSAGGLYTDSSGNEQAFVVSKTG